MKPSKFLLTSIALAAFIAAVSALPLRAQAQPLQGPKIPVPKQPRQLDARPVGPGPATLEARALNPVTVQLAWPPVPGAVAYAIIRDPNGQRDLLYQGPQRPEGPIRLEAPQAPGSFPFLGAGATGDMRLTFTLAGVRPKTTHAFAVLADYGPAGPYKPGASPLATVATPPAAQPTGFEAIAGPGKIYLKWNAAPGASGYLLQRNDIGFLNKSQLVRTTSYTDEDRLHPGTTYGYKLVAYYKVEGLGEVEGEMAQVPTAVATPKSSGPSNLRATVFPRSSVARLEWAPVPLADRYEVLLAFASDGKFYVPAQIKYAPPPPRSSLSTQAIVGSAQYDKAYYYKVVAYYGSNTAAGESEAIRVVFPPQPPPVAYLRASSPGHGQVHLEWEPAPDAIGYFIHRAYDTRVDAPLGDLFRGWEGIDLGMVTEPSFWDRKAYRAGKYKYSVWAIYGTSDVRSSSAQAEVEITTQ